VEFRIKALDSSHSVISCELDAVDEADVRRQLALKELKVISLAPLRRLRLRLALRAPQLQLAVFSSSSSRCSMPGCRWSSLWKPLLARVERKYGAHIGPDSRPLYEGQTLAMALAEHPAISPPCM